MKKVSQNLSEITRVSESRNFCKAVLESISKDLKKSRPRREKRWSRRLAKVRIYHSPPLVTARKQINKNGILRFKCELLVFLWRLVPFQSLYESYMARKAVSLKLAGIAL